MPKKTAKPLRVKKANGRRPNCGERLEMTDRDRDWFLAAMDRPPKPLPELAPRALAYPRDDSRQEYSYESSICLHLQNEVHQTMGVDAQHLSGEHSGT